VGSSIRQSLSPTGRAGRPAVSPTRGSCSWFSTTPRVAPGC